MGKHTVGKWGRGEGEEKKSARVRAKQNYAPSRVKATAWCYLCAEEHRRDECPKVEETV